MRACVHACIDTHIHVHVLTQKRCTVTTHAHTRALAPLAGKLNRGGVGQQLAEHLVSTFVLSAGQSAAASDPAPAVTRAAARASVGDMTDLTRDLGVLAGHADGVWVVDGGLEDSDAGVLQ